MTFNDLLIKKYYTNYKLAKESGVALTTILDIDSGKSNLLDCRGRILLALSKTLGESIEFLLSLEKTPYNKAYEENLPKFLTDGIKHLKREKRKEIGFYDCYWCEVSSSINVCEVEHMISHDQAQYLRDKYLEVY